MNLAHLSDEEYNADATFDYPAIPRSVEQHVAFWSRVTVPDAVIARVRAAYVERYDVWLEERMDQWAATDPEPTNGGTFSRRSYGAELEAWGPRFDAQKASIMAERPTSLPSVLARTVIRAAQMDRYAQMLATQEEYTEVVATEVDMGGTEPWTVKDTLETYHLDELPDAAFEDPTKFAGLNTVVMTNRLTDLVEILSEQTGS